MARIRTIKPEFYESVSLAKCSYLARLMYPGLWCHADDNGHGRANLALLKGQLFPYDDEIDRPQLDDLMAELADTGHIIRYNVAGQDYYLVVAFKTHQHINRPSKRGYPPPPHDAVLEFEERFGFSPGGLTEHSVSPPQLFSEPDGSPPGTLTEVDAKPQVTAFHEDSLSAHGVLHEHSHQERKGKEGKKKKENTPSVCPDSTSPDNAARPPAHPLGPNGASASAASHGDFFKALCDAAGWDSTSLPNGSRGLTGKAASAASAAGWDLTRVTEVADALIASCGYRPADATARRQFCQAVQAVAEATPDADTALIQAAVGIARKDRRHRGKKTVPLGFIATSWSELAALAVDSTDDPDKAHGDGGVFGRRRSTRNSEESGG